MEAKEFVICLKKQAKEGAYSTYDYLTNPPVKRPPAHLGEFFDLLKSLSDVQKETMRDLMHYMAEGALFELLGVLDGNYQIGPDSESRFELYYVNEEVGKRTLLNQPEEFSLQDIFNNEG